MINHSRAFRTRRFMNWFPMGLTYAFLYMGRYNLTVSKTSLGELMTKEDFGVIFATGTLVYGFAFLLNGPLTDKFGGRKALLTSAVGAGLANLTMGWFIKEMLQSADPGAVNLRFWMSLIYATNMYFQSFGAVSIVKVNAHWFHVNERGGFGGIFGTMISSGIFFAFTVNGKLLDYLSSGSNTVDPTWWVFWAPGLLLLGMAAFEFFWLRDRPGLAGHTDFDTGDASSGESDEPIPTLTLLKKILTNPIILTIGGIEFCTGVLRNGVMHWFPFYVKEIWVLPGNHMLVNGDWTAHWEIWVALFVIGIAAFIGSAFLKGKVKALVITLGASVALTPFLLAGGWGGILFVAGVLGANVAGWVSDLFFQSRRAPVAALLYGMVAACTVAMIFALGSTTNVVDWVKQAGEPFNEGDQVTAIAGTKDVQSWDQVTKAVACVPAKCIHSEWDTTTCMCSTAPESTASDLVVSTGTLSATLIRDGKTLNIDFPDPKPEMKAGDKRKLKAGPELTVSPYFLGFLIFFLSMGVIGTHGLLSGTATMDFGGRKGAATTVGIIDGLVYLGTALQSISLGFLTSISWSYWPMFLIPFSLIAILLLTRIWNSKPGKKGAH